MKKKAAMLGLAGFAGLVAAIALTFPVGALAWDWNQLPSGYGVSSYQTTCHTNTDPCVNGEGSTCNHVTVTASGEPTFAETDCVNPTFGADLDHYVDSTVCQVNPGAGGQACAPTTTAATSTSAPTTTAPATTTQPGTTTVVEPVTTTVTDPAVTEQLTALEQKFATLQQQIAALTTRVDRLALAGDASWLAYQNAVAGGADAATAAQLARDTYLNAEYGLGDFAP